MSVLIYFKDREKVSIRNKDSSILLYILKIVDSPLRYLKSNKESGKFFLAYRTDNSLLIYKIFINSVLSSKSLFAMQ